MHAIFDSKVKDFKSDVSSVIQSLFSLTTKVKNETLVTTVRDILERINDPFMFVIVGEVKSGKSSFVNALLATGEEVCKVAPDPCTDTIQQIVYGESAEETMISPYLKQIKQPVEILKQIAIVDTPGTNTISEHHQEITERFIPSSDLIVFVFEAKNPYRQSAWDFFDFIKNDWHKKVIFILQQVDLMNDEDLSVNIKGVETYAKGKGIDDPKIFPVSAKMAKEGLEGSGYDELNLFLKENITGGKAPYLKLLSSIDIASNISGRIEVGITDRSLQLEKDQEFRGEINELLVEQKTRSRRKVDELLSNLLSSYDRITLEKQDEIRHGLNFFNLVRRSFASMFSKKENGSGWLKELSRDMEDELHESLNEKISFGVQDIAESIHQMAQLIDLKIQNSNTTLKFREELFEDIAERRAEAYHELQEKFGRFMNRSESFIDKQMLPQAESISPNIAAGSGMAVIGLVLAAATKVPFLDITGGVITGLSFLFAGGTATLQKRKILNGYKEEIQKGRIKIEAEIHHKLYQYIDVIEQRINDNFKEFDDMLTHEELEIKSLGGELDKINSNLEKLASKVK